jgi:sterol desaturase/sphingolipid hydroxylase (fatty acid hydroxylase superfamily)
MSDPAEIVRYSDSYLDAFVHLLQLIVGVLMLIGPLWILNAIQDPHGKLAFISGAMVLFLLIITVLTAAKASEALAATAA